MNFNEDLFWTLLTLLEKAGFAVSTELANSIQFLFETEKIRTALDLKNSRYTLIAAIAKSSEERVLLRRVFDDPALARDTFKIGERPVRSYPSANIFWRTISRRIRLSNVKLLMIVAVLFAMLIAGFLLLRPKPVPIQFEVRDLDSQPMENTPMDFFLIAKSKVNFEYQCDFGDGSKVQDRTAILIAYTYLKKRQYKAVFTITAAGQVAGNDFILAKVILILLTAGFCLWYSLNRGLTNDIINKYFDAKNQVQFPLEPLVPAGSVSYKKDFLQIFGNLLQATVPGGHSVFDIHRSINRTINNLGFPTPFFAESAGLTRNIGLCRFVNTETLPILGR